MARILMTWELGGGYGHMAPLIALAAPLEAVGHEIAFAVRNPAVGESLCRGTGIRVHQAPANLDVAGGLVLHSFAQILLHTCFNSADQTLQRVRAWRGLYDEIQPDLVLCDHSPTALVAARSTGLKSLPIGYGFVMPPDMSPLPNLRPWDNADAAELARDESRVLDIVNATLKALGAPPLDYLAQLYAGGVQTLFTCKEFDNYAAERRSAEYLGPLCLSGGKPPRWPQGEGKRIFAYLRPFKTQPALLDALRESGQPTLIHAPGTAPELLQRYAGGKLQFTTDLLDVTPVARECDLAILHGGHGMLALMLLSGKPLLILPLYLEMLINASSALKLGAGLTAPQLRPEDMRQKLRRLLEEPGFGEAARRFAERYTDLDVKEVPFNFLPRIERMLAA